MVKDPLRTKNFGNHPEYLFLGEDTYGKVSDLRYGTNPSQTAALYNENSFLGSLLEKKTGKEGLSQTNMEDIFWAALITGFFKKPSAIIMKHENPCGFATQYELEPLHEIYKKAADADFRAAFGGVVLINRQIDLETAEFINNFFTEVIVAPDYDEGVIEKLSKGTTRIIKYDEEMFKKIPRLSRECVVTEKIDGTNGCIYISENGEFLVGSRTRWLNGQTGDNHGFSRWAHEHKEELLKLGVGIRLIALTKEGVKEL